MHIDPDAVLKCWQVDVEVAGRTYTIPALPARPWLVALNGAWSAIVPGMVEGDVEDLRDGIVAGTIAPDECRRAAQAAVEAVAGCRWWTASRLAHTAGQEIGTELLLAGFNLDREPLAAWLAAAYRIATRYAKDVDRAQLDAELDAPPQGLAVEEWFGDDSANLSGFAAAMATMGGTTTSGKKR